jgi:hypothetical protein
MDAVNPPPVEEGRTRLAAVVAAAMTDGAIKERFKHSSTEDLPIKEQPMEQTIAEPFKPINPINRVAVEEQTKEARTAHRVVKSDSGQQQKRVIKHLASEGNDISLGSVIQKAIEAARYQDTIGDGPGSTLVETTFKGSRITASADSDPVDIAVDWTSRAEQQRFKEH